VAAGPNVQFLKYVSKHPFLALRLIGEVVHSDIWFWVPAESELLGGHPSLGGEVSAGGMLPL
jgi:hypothetical protein